MTQSEQATPEYSFEVSLDDLGKTPKRYRLSANGAELKSVAKRLNTPAIEKLEGDVEVRATKNVIYVEGSLSASLIRECVASLEPMEEQVAEAFELEFSRVPPTGEVDPFDIEAPEHIESDTLDLGELLVQQLSLAMDPFPRKPDALSLAEGYGRPEKVSPFAALKDAFGKSDDNQ